MSSHRRWGGPQRHTQVRGGEGNESTRTRASITTKGGESQELGEGKRDIHKTMSVKFLKQSNSKLDPNIQT